MASDEEGVAPTIRELVLTRQGVVCSTDDLEGKPSATDNLVRGLELELANLGFVLSTRLRNQVQRASTEQLAAFCRWTTTALAAHVGGGPQHEPLFRRFPAGVPSDTEAHWWRKCLAHFLQGEDQPCLFCRQTGTTHVLDPCAHVVCDRCFDGSNFSACPVCERRVDRNSPFFRPGPERELPDERITFRLLDLGDDESAHAGALLTALCQRQQALSAGDRKALSTLLTELGSPAMDRLPSAIPVRETVALVFGTLFRLHPATDVLPVAQRYMTTATDVLRFVAVLSGTDGSLLPETIYRKIQVREESPRWRDHIRKLLQRVPRERIRGRVLHQPIQVRRFKVAKLSRPLRRALLTMLDGMVTASLVEDMLRHRSYWVWLGEFLHPHEYAKRFPNVARAFQIVRKKAPDGTPAPAFQTFYSKVEAAIASGELQRILAALEDRPGELARRFDRVVRVLNRRGREQDVERVVAALIERLPQLTTPLLVTLRHHLPPRDDRAAIRIYWPKGRVARGVAAPDLRTPLPRTAIEPTVAAIDRQLLDRFATQPGFDVAVIDSQLRDIVVPFNERTASESAVDLPRGSRVPVEIGKLVRMFLHWCEPKDDEDDTDLDLSVALYDERWTYVGVCSYYEPECKDPAGNILATSAGDRQNAPPPEGATEFVDLRVDEALAAGVRYAVMVVTAYAGLPFGLLDRAFAGLMLRDDPGGTHFDPRTVKLRFQLQGDHGVFMPVALDLRGRTLHWLDVHSKGGLSMNNVENSKNDIATVCPQMITYFGSGTRANMLDLALLHAAARCRQVIVRGAEGVVGRQFARGGAESVTAFHRRLVRGEADDATATPPAPDNPPVLAILYDGDLELPADSQVYALFRGQVTPTLAASDLLS